MKKYVVVLGYDQLSTDDNYSFEFECIHEMEAFLRTCIENGYTVMVYKKTEGRLEA